MRKPEQFPTPFVHFTGSVILEKVNGAINLPASAELNAAGSEKVIEDQREVQRGAGTIWSTFLARKFGSSFGIWTTVAIH